METEDTREFIIIILLLVSFAIFITWFRASQEANVFNRFSDKKITTWEAIWADFRILPNN